MGRPNWDQRYSEKEFAYGTQPNLFLENQIRELRDPVLSIAEGEGRNAVFIAAKGFNVHGVDGSSIGMAKAQSLAAKKGVRITTEVADLMKYNPPDNTFGSVVSIFAHLQNSIRKRLYPLIERCLKPGGTIVFESYSENQLGRTTGGPQDPDLLMTTAKIEQEFPNFEPIVLQEVEREVVEGIYHTGLASVVQFIGRKKS